MLLPRGDRFTEMKPSDLSVADARSLCKARPVLVIERQAHPPLLHPKSARERYTAGSLKEIRTERETLAPPRSQSQNYYRVNP
jgi:hypothetical protein